MYPENNTEFEFKDVVTLKPVVIYAIVLMVFIIISGLYYSIMGIGFKLSFLMIGFALIVLGSTLILKLASSVVAIAFNDHSLIIKIGHKTYVYKKINVIGLYSLNYNISKSSKIAFQILLDNGKSIYFSDIEFNDKQEEWKNKKLKKLLNKFLKELDLPEYKKVKSLNLSRMGQYFYHKKHNIGVLHNLNSIIK